MDKKSNYFSKLFRMRLCLPLCLLRVCHHVFIVSLVVILALSLTSALNKLSCNATPGAVLNLLLLAEGPCNINKLRETMD